MKTFKIGDTVEWKPHYAEGMARGRVTRITYDGRLYIEMVQGDQRPEVHFDKNEVERLSVVEPDEAKLPTTIVIPPKLRSQILEVLRWAARKPCNEENCGTVCKCEPCCARLALEELER